MLKDATERTELTEAWMELSKLSLTQTIVFNRRRAGEVSRMKMKDYENPYHVEHDKSVSEVLTALERKLSDNLYRIKIEGKRGRTVPVIFPTQV